MSVSSSAVDSGFLFIDVALQADGKCQNKLYRSMCCFCHCKCRNGYQNVDVTFECALCIIMNICSF